MLTLHRFTASFFAIVVTVAVALLFLNEPALAQEDPGVASDFAGTFHNIANWFNGNLAKGLATIAVTVVGIGALFGKIEWRTAILTGVGIAAMFGAASIHSQIYNAAGGSSSPAPTPTPTPEPTPDEPTPTPDEPTPTPDEPTPTPDEPTPTPWDEPTPTPWDEPTPTPTPTPTPF